MRRNTFETKRRRPWLPGIILGLLIGFVYFGNDLFLKFESTTPSRSFGTPGSGRIENAKRLPTSGPNFEAYSRLGASLGRASVHEKVRQVVLEAYQQMYEIDPQLRFVYGETGWPWGGDFYPHKTHRNGLSVDFLVPVLEFNSSSVMPHAIWTAWGYNNDFDENGKLDNFKIDFKTMAMHIEEVGKSAQKNGLKIRRIIFAPDLQKLLKKEKLGRKMMRSYRFSKTEAWVRHDEHYHIDFRVR